MSNGARHITAWRSHLVRSLIGGIAMCVSLLLVVSASAEMITLFDGMKTAVERSRLVRISQGDEAIAKDEALIDRSRLLPSINSEAGGTALAYKPTAVFGNIAVPTADQFYLSYSISVQQTLYDFRGNASRYEAGLEKVSARKLDTRRTRNIAAIDFAVAFFDLLESDRMVEVAGRELERLESHLRDARSLYEGGMITKNDLLQAEVRLSDARQRRINAENARSVNASRVNSALQLPLAAEVKASDLGEGDMRRLSSAVTPIGMEQAWEAAEKKRPELLIADAILRSLGLEERSKKAQYYPQFFVRGGYDYVENQYMVHDYNWSLVLGMRFNLFNGGSTRAEVSKLIHQRERLEEDRRRMVDGIRLEVERYMLDARSAAGRIAVTRDAVQQAEENLRINRTRYSEGVGTATEVLDAVTLLTVAEVNYYRSVYDLGKAQIAVLYAMGEDLTEVYK